MKALHLPLVVCLFSGFAVSASDYTVTRFAGTDVGFGSVDASGGAARITLSFGLAIGRDGSVYAPEFYTHTIRRITPEGVVSTFAGMSGAGGFVNGRGGAARFKNPWSIAADINGKLYVTDYENHAVRRILPEGETSTFAITPWKPRGIAVDRAGNVYVTGGGEVYGERVQIRRITPAGVQSVFDVPAEYRNVGSAITVNDFGELFVSAGSIICKLTIATGSWTTIGSVGSYAGVPATVYALTTHPSGGLVAARYGKIMLFERAGGVQTIAGGSFVGDNDGPALEARFFTPIGVAVTGRGDVYVSDRSVPAIRKVSGGVVSTIAGTRLRSGRILGDLGSTQFAGPHDAVVDSRGNIFVADSGTILKITPDGQVAAFAGGGWDWVDGTGIEAGFRLITGITIDAADVLYVTDFYSGTHGGKVRKISPEAVVTTLAGNSDYGDVMDGTGSQARFQQPEGLTIDAAGNLYVADYTAIRKVTQAGVVTTLAGGQYFGAADGDGSAASFAIPQGIDIDASGNLYVADSAYATIRRVTQAGEVTTFAGLAGETENVDGTGTAARFTSPVEIEFDGSGTMWVLDAGRLRRITPAGEVTTVAGAGVATGNMSGTGANARMHLPKGLALHNAGMYVMDGSSSNIRLVKPTGIADRATASSLTPAVGTTVALSTEPDTATTWNWMVQRRPPGSTAELSSTSTRNPTFTPDLPGVFTIRLEASGPAGVRYSTLDIDPPSSCEALASVAASLEGTAAVCPNGIGGTASVAVTGGGAVSIQWAWRTTAEYVLHPIAGATSASYVIHGADLGGAGTIELVATVTSSCGMPWPSNPISVTIIQPTVSISAGSGVFANTANNFASASDAGAGATYAWTITNGTIEEGQGTRQIRYSSGATGEVTLAVTTGDATCDASAQITVPILARAAGATMLYLVTPCRVLDTRETTGIFGTGTTHDVAIGGRCGIPVGARSVALNVTAIAPTAAGWAALYPSDRPWGGTSTMNYRAGKTRANNAVVSIGADGSLRLRNDGAGTHFVIDVSGYFQ